MDGITVEQLRHRAEYWRSRSAKETDPEKQARYLETATVLEREADALEDVHVSRPRGRG